MYFTKYKNLSEITLSLCISSGLDFLWRISSKNGVSTSKGCGYAATCVVAFDCFFVCFLLYRVFQKIQHSNMQLKSVLQVQFHFFKSQIALLHFWGTFIIQCTDYSAIVAVQLKKNKVHLNNFGPNSGSFSMSNDWPWPTKSATYHLWQRKEFLSELKKSTHVCNIESRKNITLWPSNKTFPFHFVSSDMSSVRRPIKTC